MDYPRLVVVQEKNGLDMGNFYRSDNACRRFIQAIYDDFMEKPMHKLPFLSNESSMLFRIPAASALAIFSMLKYWLTGTPL
jgi:hypothetical protein